EAALTALVEHPGVVPVYCLGQHADGRPFYAMKFVKGRTLAQAIAAYHEAPTPLAFRDLLRRFGHVCQAVACAHSKGVIHRDLKPANIMLGEFGEPFVLDWGLAKHLSPDGPGGETASGPVPASRRPADEGLTLAGEVLGTPAYMPPEQAEGDLRALGPAADVYALGAILYEILAGRMPYQGANSLEILEQVR